MWTRPVGGRVSPGLMPRPSLSEVGAIFDVYGPDVGVAGVDAPAFVERSNSRSADSEISSVSPGLMPRPSLSASGETGLRSLK